MDEPTTRDGYPADLAIQARRMCLYVATVLGSLLDQIVIVGGLVPYLIVEQGGDDRELHVGTRDLDLGLSIGLLNGGQYHEVASQLREAGFSPDKNDEGNETRQRWRLGTEAITVDFLIAGARGGSMQSLENDFAAIILPALPVAFIDVVDVVIDDELPTGGRAKRTIRVCGAGAFVVLKAHAIRGRAKNKDAYDLVYLLQNYGLGVADVVARFALVAAHPAAGAALTILAEDFESVDHLGPRRHATFLGDPMNAEFRQDALGAVQEFLRVVQRG